MSLADELYEAQHRRLLALLQKLSYEQREVTLASGAKSNFYIDCKQTVLTAEGHFLVGSLFGRLLATRAPEVVATFKSWDFREAYVERYAASYSLPDAERATLRKGQRDAFKRALEFHVTAQSANYKWNDIEKSSSPWRVTLLDALGHELQPEPPIRVEKLPDVYEREFFPSKTPFTRTYSLRFVPPAGSEFTGINSGAITLRFSSPIGRVELTWRT